MSNIDAGATGAVPPSDRPGRTGVARILIQVGLGILLLVVGAVVALVAEHLVGAKNNETRILTYQDWRVVCPPVGAAYPPCGLTLDVVRDQGGAVVTLALDNAALGSGLTVTVPHGVLIGPGLGFAPGNEPIRAHPYETCNPTGCIALIPVDAAMLKSLSESVTGQVVVVPNNASPATIPFSLKGFADGYAQLAREQSRRGSPFGFLFR